MADHPTSDSGPNAASEPSFNLNARRPTGRPVYESTLLPPRKRRRFSPWLIVPGLLILLLVLLYFLIFSPKPRRVVNTADTMVFASDTGSPGVMHLWSARADGSGGHPLTSGTSADTGPTFSADGNQIAFLSNRAGGQNQVWLMDGDGKDPIAVTRGGGAKSQPAFAPGSSALLGFLSGASLAVLNIGKGDSSLILPRPAGQTARPDSTDRTDALPVQAAASTVTAFAWQPAASNPGSPGLVAVLDTNGMQALAVLPTLDSSPRLTQNDKPDGPPLAAADGLTAAWSPDGSKIVAALLHVAGLPANQRASGLILLDGQGNLLRDPQGNAPRPLFAVRDPALGPQDPLYSPDGSLIAYEVWRQPDLASRARLGLFVIPSGGGPPKQIAAGDAGAAQFSRDGRSLFFLLRRPDGRHDLFREGVDGTGRTRLSDGKSDIAGFALSPQAARL
jgi:dipeptidyl aminopeptidase/acylaminoacyl peptidase